MAAAKLEERGRRRITEYTKRSLEPAHAICIGSDEVPEGCRRCFQVTTRNNSTSNSTLEIYKIYIQLTLGHNTFAYFECSVGYLHDHLLEVGSGSRRPSELRVTSKS